MDGQSAQKYSRHCVSGNSHGEQRNQGTADYSIVGGFRSDYSINNTGSELLRVLGRIFFRRVG